MFHKMSFVELFVLKRKAISAGHKINELMRDMTESYMKPIGEEVFSNSSKAKYYKNKALHNMTLTEESLDRSAEQFVRFVEANLRCN